MGYPVVLLHGMWSNASHMQRVQALLSARGYECFAPSLPAHEPSAQQFEEVGALSMRDYARSVASFMAEQGFSQPPVLVGHSMGGLLAQMLAPAIKPAALVLLTPAAPAGIHMINADLLRAALPVFCRWQFWKRAHRMSRDTFAYNAMNQHSAEVAEQRYPSLVAESGRAAFEIALWWADSQRTTAVVPGEVSCPVYVVSAGRDRLTPPAAVKKVASRYKNATLRLWPERDHWVLDDEDTELMVHEIDGWLRPVLRRRSPTKVRSL